MTYGWRDLPAMMATAPGRCELRQSGLRSLEPFLFRLAGMRRRALDRRRTFIAVTGSFGKSTTVRAVQAAIGLAECPTAVPNAGPSMALHVLFAKSKVGPRVFEVAAGKRGNVDRAARMLRPEIAVVTCIGSEHITEFKELSAIAQEKSNLLRQLGPHGTAILNGDDPHVRSMRGTVPGRTLTFGFDPGNDIRALDYQIQWPHGSRIAVQLLGQPIELSTRFVGRHMTYPLLAALAVAHLCDVDPHSACERLSRLAPTTGRLQIVRLENGAYILRDEYKSGIETMQRALDVLEEIPARRKIIVFGEITEPPAPQYRNHVRIGKRAGQLADFAVVFGKQRKAYRSGLRRGGMGAEDIVDAGRSWRKAFDALAGYLKEGDVVLLKGRHDERLERIALALTGRSVGCELIRCNTPLGRCDTCTMLESGWRHEPGFM